MKRHLTPDGALDYIIEVRPTLNVHEPNELVVIFVTKVKDDEGQLYELRNVLSADDFKLFIKDVLQDLLIAQQEHRIKTKGDQGLPPIIWKPGDNNLK